MAHSLVRSAAETCPAQCVALRLGLGKASRGGWDPLMGPPPAGHAGASLCTNRTNTPPVSQGMRQAFLLPFQAKPHWQVAVPLVSSSDYCCASNLPQAGSVDQTEHPLIDNLASMPGFAAQPQLPPRAVASPPAGDPGPFFSSPAAPCAVRTLLFALAPHALYALEAAADARDQGPGLQTVPKNVHERVLAIRKLPRD